MLPRKGQPPTKRAIVLAPLLVFLIVSATARAWCSSGPVSRREWCSKAFIIGSGLPALIVGAPAKRSGAAEIDELPMNLRDFTKLAPLGSPARQQGQEEEEEVKETNLSLSEIAAILTRDLTVGATGKGGYIVSGDLTRGIFRDDCVFVDPTNRVKSLSQYQQALRILFDPETSLVELIDPLVVVNDEEGERTISGRFRSRGFLQLPWHPYVTAYESTIVYHIDDNGLVEEQIQSWTKSSSKALQETFTPSIFTPPIACTRRASSDEPKVVTRLFEYVNGRRKDEYSEEERREIDALIQEIVAMNLPQRDSNNQSLVGKWMLVYLQPGPDGAGIDRRIPFPEFPFNDNYQIFRDNGSVTNIGELFGPPLYVKVMGDFQKLLADDQTTRATTRSAAPQRYQALINGGKLCLKETCLDLPIQGEGLFDSVYLGDRLRIGQNLNGGGARVIQVRLRLY